MSGGLKINQAWSGAVKVVSQCRRCISSTTIGKRKLKLISARYGSACKKKPSFITDTVICKISAGWLADHIDGDAVAGSGTVADITAPAAV